MIAFSYTDKIACLKKIGYEIVRETIKMNHQDLSLSGYEIAEEETWVDMVYVDNVCVTFGPRFERMYDESRVSVIFDLELRKRLIGLFS